MLEAAAKLYQLQDCGNLEHILITTIEKGQAFQALKLENV